jgi:hypothetical protein
MPCRRRALWIAGAALLAACSKPAGSGDARALEGRPIAAAITVSSPAFADGQPIPRQFTCDGDDTSPPLSWKEVPSATAELAVVVDDPDAPGGTYVHWVLFRLDPASTRLEAGVVPSGARQADNSAGDARYKGPCPPTGKPHHYRFDVYALRAATTCDDGASAGDVLRRIGATAIAKGTLTGTYQR